MPPDQAQRERHILGNTLLVALSFGLAAGMGLVRNVIMARQFGLGAELDTFYAAFKLPDLLFTVVAGGALATAFIPIFSSLLTEDQRVAAWRLASAITNLVVMAVSGLALLAALAAPWLVRTLLAPGFSPAQQAETATLMRLVLISTLFFGISAVQSSVLHSFKQFLLPALAPVVYPLGIMVGALWLAPTWGVYGLAAGAIVGALLHLLVKLPGLLRIGLRWSPVLDLHNPAVRRVLLLMGPRVLDLGVFHLTMLATTNLASRLPSGSVSALEWGWEFMQLPETIIGTAFGLVAFPTLADLAARGDLAGLRGTLGDALRMVITLTAPATLGLILLGRPLIELVYQRGAFDAQATEAVYVALTFYALGLIGHSSLELVARAFFALQDTLTPLIVAAIAGIFQVLLGIGLMTWLGHGGLALANSVAITLEVLALLWILRRRLHGVEAQATLQLGGRVAVACLVMSAVIWASSRLLAELPLPLPPALVTLAGGATLGTLVYFATGFLLKISTLHRLPAYILPRQFGRSPVV
jgi:putative peptidoglycan lipid II flippase